MVKDETTKLNKTFDRERKQFDNERDQLLRDLQNRVEKVLKLEMQLDEVKDAYRVLEASMSKEDKQFKHRAITLERNLEQISSMY